MNSGRFLILRQLQRLFGRYRTVHKLIMISGFQIHLNVIGDKAMELSRELCGDEDMGRQFRWGTTDRFLMTTVWLDHDFSVIEEEAVTNY